MDRTASARPTTSVSPPVRVELDRYWDLLRQRRAREEFGNDPEVVSLRDEATVEGYEG